MELKVVGKQQFIDLIHLGESDLKVLFDFGNLKKLIKDLITLSVSKPSDRTIKSHWRNLIVWRKFYLAMYSSSTLSFTDGLMKLIFMMESATN